MAVNEKTCLQEQAEKIAEEWRESYGRKLVTLDQAAV